MDNLHNYIVNASETLSFVSLIIFMIICIKRHMEFEVFVNKSKNENESGYIILNVKDKHAIEMTKSEFEQIRDKLNPQGVVPKEINKVGDTHD